MHRTSMASRLLLVGLLSTGGIAGGFLLLGGCQQNLTCGPNTLDMSGECVATDPAGTECGPGTYFNSTTHRCESALFDDGGGLCGPNTTLEVDDAGRHICLGTGGGVNCKDPIPCPNPSSTSKASICGRIFNIEDAQPIGDGMDATKPFSEVEVRFYEPLSFVGNPAGASPLVTVNPDECGRYAAIDVDVPLTMLIAVATDDRTGNGQDKYVLTGAAMPLQGGMKLQNVNAWITTHDTDTKWSTDSTGKPILSSGKTFGEQGVYVPIFIDTTKPAQYPFLGTPAPGVRIVDAMAPGGMVPAGDEFDFSDTDPMSRTTVVVPSGTPATGANGTALEINSPLSDHSGMGGEPTGCHWPTNQAASLPNVVFVQERNSVCM